MRAQQMGRHGGSGLRLSQEPEEISIAAAGEAVGGPLTNRNRAHSIWETHKVLAFAQRTVGDGGCFGQRTEICCRSQ